MYKMIIVDDEPLIRSGLKNLIEWEVYGIEIVGEAADGIQAYQFIKSGDIDLALIDINMPNLSGIELIELCAGLKHPPKFMILSGYNDFEYVRTALQYGAVNYLLKPVNTDELIGAIESVVQLLDDTRIQKRQYQESLMALRNDTLIRLLTNRIDSQELREKNRLVNLTFRCSSMRVGILKPLHQRDAQPGNWISLSTLKLCEETSAPACACYAALDPSDHLVLIFKDYTNLLSTSDFEQIISSCQSWLQSRTSENLITCLSENVTSVAELPAAYSSCLREAEHQEILQSLFRKDTLEQLEQNVPYSFDYSALIQCLKTQDEEALPELIRRSFQEMLCQDMDSSLESIKYRMIDLIVCSMQELRSSLLPSADIDAQKREAFHIIASSGSIGELEEKLLHFYITLMHHMNLSITPACSGLVQHVLNYVRNNYQDCNLSLKTLAASLDVNAAYLGRQFTLETNEYFSDYLNRIRIAKAIRLLSDTNLKTAAIAESVGFANISYFFTIFKKITGGRPGDYRRR